MGKYTNNSGKPESRKEYTQSLIRDALFDLLETTTIDKITVRRLCEEAGINRSTFYVHYRDIKDVVEQITTNYYNNVIRAVTDTLDPAAPESARIHLSSLVFETEYGLKILRHPEVFIFGEEHKMIDQAYVEYIVENTTLTSKEASYLYAFITYGLMGMAKQMLLANDYHSMIYNMDKIYRNIIDTGLAYYKKIDEQTD